MVVMEEVIERIVMRLNEVCESVTEKYATDGELGDFCSQLLKNDKFVQWELFRELYINLNEFESTLNKKRGAGSVNFEIIQDANYQRTCTGLMKLINIPRHGDSLAISLDVQQEGVADDDLLNSVFRQRKQLDEQEIQASFLLWVTTSQQSTGDSLDTNIKHLAEKNLNTRPKQSFMWDVVKNTAFELQFQLCPPGSRLSLTLWRLN